MLYFSSAPVRPDSIDDAQYRALREFKKSIGKRAIVIDYDSPADFQRKLNQQLAQAMIRYFEPDPRDRSGLEEKIDRLVKRVLSAGEVAALNSPESPAITEDARTLLSEAAKDPNGMVLKILTFGGLEVQTNGQKFLQDPQDPRQQAKWRDAVQQLVDQDLLEQRDREGQVFQVTNRGYQVAETSK